MSTFRFRNGSKINRHGKRWTVTSFGPRVRLQNARGRVKEDRLVDILNDGEFIGVETAPREAPWRSPLEFDLLPLEQARKAAEQVDFWRPHISDVLTGYQSGSADARLPGEPREQYDPVRQLGQRIRAKAEEVTNDGDLDPNCSTQRSTYHRLRLGCYRRPTFCQCAGG